MNILLNNVDLQITLTTVWEYNYFIPGFFFNRINTEVKD